MSQGLYKRGRFWWYSFQCNGRQIRESSRSPSKRIALQLRDSRRAECASPVHKVQTGDISDLQKVLAELLALLRQLLAGAERQATTSPLQHVAGEGGKPTQDDPEDTPTLKECSKIFLRRVSRKGTHDRYRISLNHLIEALGNPRVSSITTPQLYQYQAIRIDAGASPATVNRNIAALSRMFALLKKHGVLKGPNPCCDVEKLNETETRRSGEPFTRKEEACITAAASGWFRILFIVLIETGLRVKREALPLKWSDVDLDVDPGRLIVRQSKTLAGVRTVFLTGYCSNELRKWKEIAGPEFSEFIFANPGNPSKHIADYKQRWKTIAKKAGVDGHRFYDTRATFATRVNACGQSILTVAQLLGHKATSTAVLPAYVRPLDENTRSIVNALDAARTAALKPPVLQ